MSVSFMIISIAIKICTIKASSTSTPLIHFPGPLAKTRVRITNKVTPESILTVHCKSKDDDLGTHDLPPNGSYEFYFRPRFFGGTLYFCLMEWPNISHYFDVYRQDRDRPRCFKDCCWDINPTGPCDSNSGQCFRWNRDDNKD